MTARSGGRRAALLDGDQTEGAMMVGDPPLPVRISRSRRARRLSLSVSRLDGGARLTAPAACSRTEIRAFLAAHQTWLAEAVARAPAPAPLTDGAVIPFEGRPIRLRHAPGRRGVALAPDEPALLVGGAPAALGRRALVWLREQARAALSARSAVHARALGVTVARLSIKDTRSRWGSCSATGAIAYSWRLILAPPDVLDYVAAHEVAHLRELNHSARFWALVAERRPDWRCQRDWLKRHGAELHRYVATP